MDFASIDTFKNQVRGVQRSSLFQISITEPGYIVDTYSASSIIQYTCKSASIPGSSLGIIEVPYMGRKIKYPGDRTYQDWNTTMIVDMDWKSYKFLYEWHKTFNGPNSNRATSGYVYTAYKTNIDIAAYRIDGEKADFTMRMIGAFPSEIDEVEMAWDNTDSTAELQVTWAFDYVIRVGSDNN